MTKTQEVRWLIERIQGSFDNRGLAISKWGASNDSGLENLVARLYELRNEIVVTSDQNQSESDNRPAGT